MRRPEGDFGKPSAENFPSRDFFGLENIFFIEGLCLWSKLFWASGISVIVSFSYFSSSSLLCFAVHFLLIFLVYIEERKVLFNKHINVNSRERSHVQSLLPPLHISPSLWTTEILLPSAGIILNENGSLDKLIMKSWTLGRNLEDLWSVLIWKIKTFKTWRESKIKNYLPGFFQLVVVGVFIIVFDLDTVRSVR